MTCGCVLQLNCCGAVGPQDYKFSEWFNRTPTPEARFVPPSCCVLRNDDLRNLDVVDENICQIDAISFLYENSALNKTQLKTRVRLTLSSATARFEQYRGREGRLQELLVYSWVRLKTCSRRKLDSGVPIGSQRTCSHGKMHKN